MTKFQVSIANNDIEYFKPILELCENGILLPKFIEMKIKLNKDG